MTVMGGGGGGGGVDSLNIGKGGVDLKWVIVTKT